MHYFGDFCDNVFENLEETPGDAGASFPGGKNYGKNFFILCTAPI